VPNGRAYVYERITHDRHDTYAELPQQEEPGYDLAHDVCDLCRDDVVGCSERHARSASRLTRMRKLPFALRVSVSQTACCRPDEGLTSTANASRTATAVSVSSGRINVTTLEATIAWMQRAATVTARPPRHIRSAKA
jgi:hypothetical protein